MDKRQQKKIIRIANRLLRLQSNIENGINVEENSLELQRLKDELSFETMAEVDEYIMSQDYYY